MGEARKRLLRFNFDPRLRLEFHGAKGVTHGRYVTVQMAEGAVSRQVFRAILERIRRLWLPPPAPDTG